MGPGQLERQRCLARAGIAAQHHKVAVLAPEGVPCTFSIPQEIESQVALALVETQGPSSVTIPGRSPDALLLFHQLLDLLQGHAVDLIGGQALDAQRLGLLEVQIDLHVGGGGGGLVRALIKRA